MLIAPSDRYLIENSVMYVKDYKGPLDIVIDIGAHVGTFSVHCAARGAKVYAYEPSNWNFSCLVGNVEAARGLLGSIIPLKYAVTDKSGDVEYLRKAGHGTGQQSLCYRADRWPIENDCATLSLKDVLTNVFASEGKIDYLKCDIEGSEHRFYDMDEETRGLVGRVGFIEMSVHPLSNARYHESTGDVDYAAKMTNWLTLCGLPKERYLLVLV